MAGPLGLAQFAVTEDFRVAEQFFVMDRDRVGLPHATTTG